MPETLKLLVFQLGYLLSAVIMIGAAVFFMNEMPVTGFFTLLAGLVILPLAERVIDMKFDSRFLLMSALLVIGALFIPPLHDMPFVS